VAIVVFVAVLLVVAAAGYVVYVHDHSSPPAATAQGKSYPVTFSESGLPRGAGWGVSVNGGTNTSTSASFVIDLPTGTFQYSLTPLAGFIAPLHGTVDVGDAAASVNITFHPYELTVTFNETGAPSGTAWSVTLNGTEQGSTTTTDVFDEPNGTYSFTAGSSEGFTISPSAGQLTVNGVDVAVALGISGTLTLTETGSNLLYPLFESWGPNYTAYNRSVLLNPGGTGSEAGHQTPRKASWTSGRRMAISSTRARRGSSTSRSPSLPSPSTMTCPGSPAL